MRDGPANHDGQQGPVAVSSDAVGLAVAGGSLGLADGSIWAQASSTGSARSATIVRRDGRCAITRDSAERRRWFTFSLLGRLVWLVDQTNLGRDYSPPKNLLMRSVSSEKAQRSVILPSFM